MISVTTKLTVTNETDNIGKAIVGLVQSYIPGIGYVKYGFRTLGVSQDITYPCLFVEPVRKVSTMVTTAEFQTKNTYHLYFYVIENSPDAVITLSTSIGENLEKLFSNNALDDLNGGANTRQFKQYPGFWINSEMTSVIYGPYFISADPKFTKSLMRWGYMTFETLNVYLK